MKIIYSQQFQKEFRDMSEEIKDKAEQREKIFRENPFDIRLKTHKLSGRLYDLWSFSIDYRYRIIFEFIDGDKIVFHVIGDHSIYGRG
jgi:addiction module RelE/StbE family toxin